MAKVSVIGAGNVGATCAYAIAQMGFSNEIVLLDVREGFAEGKAMDMMQSAKMFHYRTKITGCTNDYKKTAKSDVVVITSGIPRKPGMTREELIGTNAKIVNEVISNVIAYSPNAKIVVVANPMDTMTYLAVKKSGISSKRIIGMGGMLDSSRFNYYISQTLKIASSDIDGMVIGGHSDTTMVPLMSLVRNKGGKVNATNAQKESIVAQTMVGGATLTKLIGTSAWYAPGACAAALARAIVMDEKRTLPCCVYLEGEYGQNDICIGVPAVIGKNGVEKIVKIDISKEEKEKFDSSAAAVRKTNLVLKELGII
jgi:malate dehydrogenase